jgi:hypothetical protein
MGAIPDANLAFAIAADDIVLAPVMQIGYIVFAVQSTVFSGPMDIWP